MYNVQDVLAYEVMNTLDNCQMELDITKIPCMLLLRCRCCWPGVVCTHKLLSSRLACSHHCHCQRRWSPRQGCLLRQWHCESPGCTHLPGSKPLHAAASSCTCGLCGRLGVGRVQPELRRRCGDGVVHCQHASEQWVSDGEPCRARAQVSCCQRHSVSCRVSWQDIVQCRFACMQSSSAYLALLADRAARWYALRYRGHCMCSGKACQALDYTRVTQHTHCAST